MHAQTFGMNNRYTRSEFIVPEDIDNSPPFLPYGKNPAEYSYEQVSSSSYCLEYVNTKVNIKLVQVLDMPYE